jgi:hypothetical protein
MPNRTIPAAETGLPTELSDALIELDTYLFQAMGRMAVLDVVIECGKCFGHDERGEGAESLFYDAFTSIKAARETFEEVNRAAHKALPAAARKARVGVSGYDPALGIGDRVVVEVAGHIVVTNTEGPVTKYAVQPDDPRAAVFLASSEYVFPEDDDGDPALGAAA